MTEPAKTLEREPGTDRVFLRNIKLTTIAGYDCWQRFKAQPVLLSVSMLTDIDRAAQGDDVAHTIDYGAVYRALIDRLSKFEARNTSQFAYEAGLTCLDLEVCREVEIEVRLPKGHLQSEHIDGGGFTLRMVMKRTSTGIMDDITEAVLKTQLSCIIGVNPHEREAKQPIILTLSSPSHLFFFKGGATLLPLFKQIDASSYQTLEALGNFICHDAIYRMKCPAVTVTLEKPVAYGSVDGPGITMTRSRPS